MVLLSSNPPLRSVQLYKYPVLTLQSLQSCRLLPVCKAAMKIAAIKSCSHAAIACGIKLPTFSCNKFFLSQELVLIENTKIFLVRNSVAQTLSVAFPVHPLFEYDLKGKNYDRNMTIFYPSREKLNVCTNNALDRKTRLTWFYLSNP